MFQEDDPRARGAEPVSEDLVPTHRPIGKMQFRQGFGDTGVCIYRDGSGQLWREIGSTFKLPKGYMLAP